MTTPTTTASATPAAAPAEELSDTWIVIHAPNGLGLDAAEAATLDYDEPVEEGQAWADAEYNHADDFGAVFDVIAGDDPEAALEAWQARQETPSDPETSL